MISRRVHLLVGLLLLGVIAAIGWYGYWTLPRGVLIPGLSRFTVLFLGGLALPYVTSLVLLILQDGRQGMRLAFGTAFVNAIWVLPLGTVLLLFAGFTMGNRDQEQALAAVVSGAALQILLLIVTGAALWKGRKLAQPASGAWLAAFVFPLVASGTSWAYLEWQVKATKAQSAQAGVNSRDAQETIKLFQDCLSGFQGKGYPVTIDACPDGAARVSANSGYQFEYLPALADASGRRGAYQLCARPKEFRATGYETVVANSAGVYGAGVAEQATLDRTPTCASVLSVDRALAWCAYELAAHGLSSGYPTQLADMTACLGQRDDLGAVGPDRVTTKGGEVFAYLAGPSDASGSVSTFRIYRLRHVEGQSVWIDEWLRESAKKGAKAGPVIEGLPDEAVPERFDPGCLAGRGDDCYVAGSEWERKAFQAERGAQAASIPSMREAARKAYAQGCELRDARSCVSAASELEYGRDVPRDVVRAAALYERACALGYADGCRHAGNMFESGRKAKTESLYPQVPPAPPGLDLPKDVPRAVTLYHRACEGYDEQACFIAGRLLAGGEGMPADPERAFGYFSRLCGDGMSEACSRAAELSPNQREHYLRRACVLGKSESCL
jgi:TPR repeat protein